jgi:OmpA-OmpF porin, OOP family
MKKGTLLIFIGLILLIAPGLNAQTKDAEGCKDHPMFSCIPNFHITGCTVKDYNVFSFPVESRIGDDSKKQSVEGNYFFYSYYVNEGAQQKFSLLTFRNIEDELIQNKGNVVARVVEPLNSGSFITGKIARDNVDTWVFIKASGEDYQLTIIEKHRKVNVITADSMWNTLIKKDSISLDIFFDDNAETIIPASLPIIDQIDQMLKKHPSLKLNIQSYTDNRRQFPDDRILTANRAKVVLDSLNFRGTPKTRLSSIGWGKDKPVADNSTDEGRAKNRRIVIARVKE